MRKRPGSMYCACVWRFQASSPTRSMVSNFKQGLVETRRSHEILPLLSTLGTIKRQGVILFIVSILIEIFFLLTVSTVSNYRHGHEP